MAKCEKCSAEIAEGMTLCETCANEGEQSVNFWARPGSVVNSGNSYVKLATPTAQEEKAEQPAQNNNNEPVAEPASNNELDMRLKQTEFFNAVANVDEAEAPDIDELYPPSNLLEVPFKDTEYNLGYAIPKMKMVVSKQSRKRILISSLIVSGVAVLIAAFIMLESIFGFLPRVVDTPVLYVKSGNLYMTGTSGKRPEHFSYDGNAFQVSQNVQRILFSPYSDDIFVLKDYNTKTKSYSLYIRRDGEISGQGQVVDNNIIGDFVYVQNGKAILYLKGTTSYNLYLYNIDKGESTRVINGVQQFALLDDTNVAIFTNSEDIKVINLAKSGKEAVTEIVQDADSVYFDSEPTKAFFFIKSLKNTETGEDVSELYRYNEGKTEKLASNVSDLASYNCAENWAYCTGDNGHKVTVADFVNDDCEKHDRESTEGVYWTDDMSTEMATMVKRNNLRQRVFPIEVPLDTFALSFYSKGKTEVITENCTEVIFTGERGPISNKEVADIAQGAAIVYKEYEPAQKLITFSELTDDLLNYRTFVNYMNDITSAVKKNTFYAAAVKGKSSKLSYTAVNEAHISFSKKFDALYYIDYTEDEKIGDLMQVKVTDKGFESPEPVALGATEFYLLADGTVIYVDGDKTIYAGAEALAHRISGYSVNQAADTVAILAESIDTGSRLVIFKDRTKKAIAESVRSVCFNDNSTLSFVKDYDNVAGGGDFYICKNFTTTSRIDTGVSAPIKLKY